MNIDDLKSLMDEFDPAALLPEIDTIVGKAELVMRIAIMVGPIILMVMGLMYLFASPKEVNYYFGYRCYFGMGSVDAWRFSQRLAGIVWGGLGLILTIVMVLICSSFRGMEVMDMVGSAVKCVIWQVVLVAAACLAINAVVAMRFNRRGERRLKKEE